MQLRDGSQTSDPRLGRLRQFDERSRAFAIRPLVAGKPLRSYTWRVDWWLKQPDGSCVGFSLTHDAVARPVCEFQGESVEFVERYARETVYWEAQKIDPWDGGSYPGAPPPHYEGTSVLAGAKVCQSLGHFLEYRWAFGLNDVILALGYAGPIVLGIDWHRDMAEAESDGRIRPRGELLGGHAILAYKVQVATRRNPVPKVWLHNSWGQSWGLNGRCYLTFEDLDQLLHAGGECCIPVKRRRTA